MNEYLSVCWECNWQGGCCSKEEAWKRYYDHMKDKHHGEGKGQVLEVLKTKCWFCKKEIKKGEEIGFCTNPWRKPGEKEESGYAHEKCVDQWE